MSTQSIDSTLAHIRKMPRDKIQETYAHCAANARLVLAAHGFHAGQDPTKRDAQFAKLCDAIQADAQYRVSPRIQLNFDTLQKNPAIVAALDQQPLLYCVPWEPQSAHLCETGKAQKFLSRCTHKHGILHCDLAAAPECCYMYYMTGRCPFSTPCGADTKAVSGTCPARCHLRPWTGPVPHEAGTKMQPLPHSADDRVDFSKIFLVGMASDANKLRPSFTPEGDASIKQHSTALMKTFHKRTNHAANIGEFANDLLESTLEYARSRRNEHVRDRILTDLKSTMALLTPSAPPQGPERTKRQREE